MLVWQDKQALILKTRNPDRILNVLPSAKQFKVKGDPFVAVPHRTRETVALRHFCLLYTSPSPRDVEECRMPSSA